MTTLLIRPMASESPECATTQKAVEFSFHKTAYGCRLAEITGQTLNVAGAAVMLLAMAAVLCNGCRRQSVPEPARAPSTPAPAVAAFTETLEKTLPQRGQAWRNSLGQEFVPVPDLDVLFCKWETRVQDFEAFVKATGYNGTTGLCTLMLDPHTTNLTEKGDSWKSPGFKQGPTHPVCGVSWHDAKAFCDWLTQKERETGWLAEGQVYRLPMDLEWSVAVGLIGERGSTPKTRMTEFQGIYPWGREWPPPELAENYRGQETQLPLAIEAYNDGFPRTAPVGSFSPNEHGICDMGGNVKEWCEDHYTPSEKWRVVRGCDWFCIGSNACMSANRGGDGPDSFRSFTGFRVVVTVPPEQQERSKQELSP